MPGKYKFRPTPETIWDQPDFGMDKNQFYASVYTVEIKQFQQGETDGQLPLNEQNKTADRFLDRLALLFANHKKKNSKETPKHVTATGLVKELELWTIYIAKNDGLMKPDEELLGTLEDWINDKIKYCDEPSVHNKVWTEMVAHWVERIEYYTSEITKFWNSASSRKSEFQAKLKDDAEQRKAFLEGWKEEEKLANYAAKLKQRQKDEAVTILEVFYYFRKDGSETEFPQLDKEPGFTKFIYHMEMLGMLQSMWNAFLEFRRYKGQNKIEFMIIERCKGSRLPKEDIQRTIQDWKMERPHIDVSAPEQRLDKMTSPPELYFHCELQIRLVFHYLGKGYKFIGCSKLSCELCWCILDGGNHITRGSHHKLSTNCAFPFPSDLTDVAERMNRVQDRYKRKIFDNPPYDWKNYPGLVDTLPGRTEVLIDKTYVQARMQELALRDYSAMSKGEGLYGPYKADKDMKSFRGGFALVHQVVKQSKGSGGAQADQQASYALKEIRIRDENQCEMVHREVEILRKVKHSNILELVEAFYVSDLRTVFLATQPWAPLSLGKLLRNALDNKFEP